VHSKTKKNNGIETRFWQNIMLFIEQRQATQNPHTSFLSNAATFIHSHPAGVTVFRRLRNTKLNGPEEIWALHGPRDVPKLEILPRWSPEKKHLEFQPTGAVF
jgi:hypothetical protein